MDTEPFIIEANDTIEIHFSEILVVYKIFLMVSLIFILRVLFI